MKRLYFWAKPGAVDAFIESIKKGKVVLADSDTVLGLFAAVNTAGVQALDNIKIRRDKPYLILIGDKHAWAGYAQTPSNQAVVSLIEACWPGPLTLIMPMRADVPSYIGSASGAVGIRMPDHKELCEVARACDGIFSTSANKAGCPIPTTIADVDVAIQQAVDCIVLSPTDTLSTLPSTILDCTQQTIRVVREGAYAIAELERVCGQSFMR